MRSIAFASVMALFLLCNSGCFHHRVSRSESGQYVNGRDFAQIKPGKTSSAWAKAMLGEPSEIKKSDGGSEIWRWNYKRTKTVDGKVLIISGDTTETYHRQAMVEVKDGIVINKWFDDRDVTTSQNIN